VLKKHSNSANVARNGYKKDKLNELHDKLLTHNGIFLINDNTYLCKAPPESLPIKAYDKRRNVAKSPQQVFTYKPVINNPYNSPFLIPVLSTKQVRSHNGKIITEYSEKSTQPKRKSDRKHYNAQLSMHVA